MILFIFAVIGLTHILVDSILLGPLHEWIKPRCAWLGTLLGCHQCCGFWCGVLLAPVLPSWNPLIWLAAGCAGSFLAQLGFWTLEALEHTAEDI
ncbi:MAG: hypothetical protein ACYDH4_12050 [Candidatus Cryosericum sp.]